MCHVTIFCILCSVASIHKAAGSTGKATLSPQESLWMSDTAQHEQSPRILTKALP